MNNTIKVFAITGDEHEQLDVFINEYNVSSNAQYYNYNIHELTIDNVSPELYSLLTQKQIYLKVEIEKDGIKKISNIFKIIECDELNLFQDKFEVQLSLVNIQVYELFSSTIIANELLKINNGWTMSSNSFNILSNIMDIYKKTLRGKVRTSYNDNGLTGYVYETFRLPDIIKDIEVPEYLFEHFNPYYLQPYFIIDDFVFDEDIDFQINVINFHNIESNIHIDIRNSKVQLKNDTIFLNSENIIDRDYFNKLIRSNILLQNKNADTLYKIVPKEVNSLNSFTFDINEDKNIYLDKLKKRKQLVNYNSKFFTYKYTNFDFNIFKPNQVYNLNDRITYDSVVIDKMYSFERTINGGIESMEVTFANIPPVI